MLVLIPARGGSKGLPGKNIRPLNGKPLICHSIQAALAAKLVDRVVVTTDDDAIARCARDCGADVPFLRPAHLAEDDSMVMDAYLHAADYVAQETGEKVEAFTALLPTSPLRLPMDIDAAIEIFRARKADSVISVVEAPVPIQWYRKLDADGVLRDMNEHSDAVSNRQAHETAYVPNGSIYIFRTEVLRTRRQYYTEKTYPYIMPRERSGDIDDSLDFDWVEYLLKRRGEDT